MKLIERYLHEIGRHLPVKKRADILSELRSVLEDSLEAKAGPEPTEADAAAVIKDMGAPRQVAAGYSPANQYLVGPELYPLFRMVLGIVLLASIGGQLVAILVSVLFQSGDVRFFETLAGMLNSIPAALGMVVFIFYLLQRFEVKPEQQEEAFDPYALPDFEAEEPVKRVEESIGIVLSVVFFIVLAWMADQGAFGWSRESGFIQNPVLAENFFWIGLSIVAGVILSIVLLWRGRWQTSTRIANLLVNLFSLGVLFKLISGHRAWLLAAGYSGNFLVITELPTAINDGSQVIVMLGTQIGLTVAAIVVTIDTVVSLVKMVIRASRGTRPAEFKLPIAQ